MAVTPQQTAAALIRRQTGRREQWARTADEVRRRIERGARQALDRGLITRAWLIGSLIDGTFGEGSDADLVVEGLKRGSLGEFQNLVLPLPVELDLLDLEELPAGFRASVLSDGVLLK